MKWYPRYSLKEILDEPVCVVGYLFEYCKYWELQEGEKVKLMALGGTLKGMA